MNSKIINDVTPIKIQNYLRPTRPLKAPNCLKKVVNPFHSYVGWSLVIRQK